MTERWTIQKYREYIKNQSKPRKHKYNAKKTVVDGITFDSQKEANYYSDLKLLKRSGEIKGFDLQPEFLIHDGYIKDGKKVRAIKYIADFKVFHNDGSVEIVDVKGYETKTFKMKKKMFENRYPDLKLTIL